METPRYPSSLEIQPLTDPPDTVLAVPGSKSLTNRALILAALADGVSTLQGALTSDDTRVMLNSRRTMSGTLAIEACAQVCRPRARAASMIVCKNIP